MVAAEARLAAAVVGAVSMVVGMAPGGGRLPPPPQDGPRGGWRLTVAGWVNDPSAPPPPPPRGSVSLVARADVLGSSPTPAAPIDPETQQLAETLGAAAVRRATSGDVAVAPKKMPVKKKPAAAPPVLAAPLPAGLVKRVAEMHIDEPPSDPGASSSGGVVEPPPAKRSLPPKESGNDKGGAALISVGEGSVELRRTSGVTRR